MSDNGVHDWEQRYRELAAMTGQLAHELRNPLSALTLNLGILLQDFDPPQTPREHRARLRLDRMQRECSSLKELLNGFLQFLRAGEREDERIRLNELVRDFVAYFRTVARASDVELVAHLDDELPLLVGNSALLHQMLLNLAQNAVDAMPEGGRIEILTRLAGTSVELSIIDSGPGIAPEARDKIFQPFFSTRRSGTGLGLAVVRRIVQSHGGTITCDSEPGKGTRFTIRFPVPAAVGNSV